MLEGSTLRKPQAVLDPLDERGKGDATLYPRIHPQQREEKKAGGAKGRFGRAAPAPIKELGESPVTGKPVRVLNGRYGPYINDGETNANVPKEKKPEDVTFDEALSLLAARAEEHGAALHDDMDVVLVGMIVQTVLAAARQPVISSTESLVQRRTRSGRLEGANRF